MTNQELLVWFMYAKQKIIRKVLQDKSIIFMNIDIENDIKSWSNRKVKKVIEHILYIYDICKQEYSSYSLSDGNLCPYCVSRYLKYIEYCDDCFYSKVFGQCKYSGSNYQQIISGKYKRLVYIICDNNNDVKLMKKFKKLYYQA